MLNSGFNQIDIQKKALDASWLRQQVLSNNIANVNTPGYKRQDVDFEQMLQSFLAGQRLGMAATHTAHFGGQNQTINGLAASVRTDRSTSLRIDGNNVNIDTEMAAVAQNQIRYSAVTNQINAQIRRMKSAIRGGA